MPPPGEPPGNPYPPPTNQLTIRQPPPAVASRSRAGATVDPSLTGDDHDSDIENYDPRAALSARAKPAQKVGGRRLPATKDYKGKGRAVGEVPIKAGTKRKATSQASARETKRGRKGGVANYSKNDVSAMLDIAEETLPVGPKGWDDLAVEFKHYAIRHNRPVRSGDSLHNKFKQVRIQYWIHFIFNNNQFCSSSKKPSQLAMLSALRKLSGPTRSTIR